MNINLLNLEKNNLENQLETALKNVDDLKLQIENYKKLNEQIQKEAEKYKNQALYYKQLYELRCKALFARKNEERVDAGQMTLFDGIELGTKEKELKEKIEEKKNEETDSKKVKKEKKHILLTNPNLPVEIIEVILEEEGLIDIKSDEIERKICYTPGKYFIKEYHIHQYKKVVDGEAIIVRGKHEFSMGKSIFDSSFINNTIVEKIVKSVPLYRQEKSLKQESIDISRQDLANGCYQGYNVYKPVIEKINEYISQAEIIRCDETTCVVIEINNRKPEAKSKSYIWGMATGNGYYPAIRYELGPGRDKEVAIRLLTNEKEKYVQSDCYNAYTGLKNVTNVFCFAHMNRKFKSLIDNNTKDDSPEALIVNSISKIYHEEHMIKKTYNNDYEKIKEQRIIIIKPLVDVLYQYIEQISLKTSPKSGLGRALAYSINSKEGIYNIFLDGRLDLDTNYCEREVIKPFVIGRKNWLFSNTSKGCNATCGLYGLVRTAVLNNLNPYLYLEYLANNLPIYPPKDFDYSAFLPWSDKIPNEIKSQKNNA